MAENEREREQQRAINLWEALARKFPALGKAARCEPSPQVDFDAIGGLAEPKEEILTYACAATNPEVYQRWGTVPAPALLLIGPAESGKSLLAEALAVRTGTPLLTVRVPRLVLQLLHAPGNVGPLIEAWGETLDEMPRLTVFFRELDFSHVHALVSRRPDLPTGPIMDFVLELIDRSVAVAATLVVGSTSHPETISAAFLEPGRFERIVSVSPVTPDDIVEALRIHARKAEERAGRTLFDAVDWQEAVKRSHPESIGEWVRLLHAVLRRKARCDAAEEAPGPVATEDLIAEAERFRKTVTRISARSGTYL